MNKEEMWSLQEEKQHFNKVHKYMAFGLMLLQCVCF